MRTPTFLLTALAITFTGCASLPHRSPEAELAQRLDGRVAGAPERCIDLGRVTSVAIENGAGLVYDAGSVLFVNRTNRPETLRAFDTLQVTSFAGQLCRGEPVNLIDPSTRSPHAFVILEEFVPYRRR